MTASYFAALLPGGWNPALCGMPRQDHFNDFYSPGKDLPTLHWSPEEGEISFKQNLKDKVPTAMEARLVFKKKYIPAAI